MPDTVSFASDQGCVCHVMRNRLQQRIEYGLYALGSRLLSVRKLSREYGVNISTVQQFFRYHLFYAQCSGSWKYLNRVKS